MDRGSVDDHQYGVDDDDDNHDGDAGRDADVSDDVKLGSYNYE